MEQPTIVIQPDKLTKEQLITEPESEEASILESICCIFSRDLTLMCSTPVLVLSVKVNSCSRSRSKQILKRINCRYGRLN